MALFYLQLVPNKDKSYTATYVARLYGQMNTQRLVPSYKTSRGLIIKGEFPD